MICLSVHAESVSGLREETKLKVTVDKHTDDVALSKLSHRQVVEQTVCFSLTPQIVVFSVVRIRISFMCSQTSNLTNQGILY